MKRYTNLYESICSYDNILLAHKKAKLGKAHYTEVKMIESNVDYYVKQIQQMLIDKTFTTSKYRIEIINDRGKEREIYKLPYYPDRIIHHAILNIIEPIFMKTFTADTCAALKGRGGHYALKRLRKALKDDVENTQYCLKIDVRKFFPNINHEILKNMLLKKFKDKDLLDLLFNIIDSVEGGNNVPIGNYSSQYLSNFYLSYFDHWVKEEKKVKYYFRYMDDCVFLSDSKDFLHALLKDIKEYLDVNLKLELKPNYQVFPVDIRGIDFVGYRCFRNFTLLRKSTAKRYKKKMKMCTENTSHNRMSVSSYDGWLKWCDSYNLKKKYKPKWYKLKSKKSKKNRKKG